MLLFVFVYFFYWVDFSGDLMGEMSSHSGPHLVNNNGTETIVYPDSRAASSAYRASSWGKAVFRTGDGRVMEVDDRLEVWIWADNLKDRSTLAAPPKRAEYLDRKRQKQVRGTQGSVAQGYRHAKPPLHLSAPRKGSLVEIAALHLSCLSAEREGSVVVGSCGGVGQETSGERMK